MYQDPLFLIGLMGAIGCIGWWILDNLRGEGSEELEENLNRIGLIFSVLIIWRLFVNAGDLGILLFFGSIICLLILLAAAKSINKQIIEPKNNKIPKSPAFTNNLQMIKTEKINPIRLRFSSSSSEPSPLRLSNIHHPIQPMAPINPIKNSGS